MVDLNYPLSLLSEALWQIVCDIFKKKKQITVGLHVFFVKKWLCSCFFRERKMFPGGLLAFELKFYNNAFSFSTKIEITFEPVYCSFAPAQHKNTPKFFRWHGKDWICDSSFSSVADACPSASYGELVTWWRSTFGSVSCWGEEMRHVRNARPSFLNEKRSRGQPEPYPLPPGRWVRRIFSSSRQRSATEIRPFVTRIPR